MANPDPKWTVLPHRPIEKHAENLWSVEGRLPNMALKRRMCVARRSDGRLVIHSAIALEEEAQRELEGWGDPETMIVPNGWHRLDAPAYKARYPNLIALAPAGSRKKVDQAIPTDGDLSRFENDESISVETLEGCAQREGVLLVRSEEGTTLIFNDLLFNLPHGPGLGGLIFRLIGSTGGPKVTRIARMGLVKDRRALGDHLLRLAETHKPVRLVPGHGKVVSENAAATLKSVAAALMK